MEKSYNTYTLLEKEEKRQMIKYYNKKMRDPLNKKVGFYIVVMSKELYEPAARDKILNYKPKEDLRNVIDFKKENCPRCKELIESQEEKQWHCKTMLVQKLLKIKGTNCVYHYECTIEEQCVNSFLKKKHTTNSSAPFTPGSVAYYLEGFDPPPDFSTDKVQSN